MVTIQAAISPPVIKDSDLVKVTQMGNITEIQYMQHVNKTCPIARIEKGMEVFDSHTGELITSDGTHFIVKKTGEVKQFSQFESRKDSKASLYRTFAKAREIINSNVYDPTHCLWVTLTYAENMTDTEKLCHDFGNFFSDLRDYCFDNGFERPEYIALMEPQGRGAWHVHMLILFDSAAPFIPSDVLQSLWGHGFVKIKLLRNVDNVGAYLTAYLGDMELTDHVDSSGLPVKVVDVLDDDGRTVSKKYIKGGRLHLYPPGFHMLRYSRGVKKAVVREVPHIEALSMVNDIPCDYRITSTVSDPDTGFENLIDKRYYNKLRK